MKIETSSFVFTGLSYRALYAALNDNSDARQTWIVAAGGRESAAAQAMRCLNEISVNNPDISGSFAKANAVLGTGNEVSAAGLVFDGEQFFPFNTGAARVLLFRKGNLKKNTDDQTEAYALLPAGADAESAAYDQLRNDSRSGCLTKALGKSGDAGKPVFYGEGIPAMPDDAFVICTAAFWQYLSVFEMEIDFRKSATADEWLRYMVKRVLMNSQGRLDTRNFAVITGIITNA